MDRSRRKVRQRRIRSRVHGTAARPRVSVFRSARYLTLQFIDDDQGRTLLALSTEPKASATKVVEAQSLGEAAAAQALAKGISHVVFDRGGYAYHGRVKAVADALRAGGVHL